MAEIKDTLADWLRDAYAMENQAVEMLERQTERLEHYPDMLAKVREHVAVTRRQADRVRECLQRLGTDTSSIKTGIGMLIGNAQSLSGIFASDEVVKAGIFNYAFEQFEIANYRVLVATARQIGDAEVARLLEENLREEEEMAAWIESNLPQLTQTYLQRKMAGQHAEAKR
ncbi:ferritin-like domain-containing protein [Azospirillum sp.]|uniref:ferritin-like domain-containing protein n=1 Tax=Azospirillum sp. TaxID=34012 RepID=UPI002D53D5B1|nr:ferritin-like domain-containing protein [Azospirillum sp.]HYD70186.1 ferritin-like domain-containing protein [Azospirillum sp.]